MDKRIDATSPNEPAAKRSISKKRWAELLAGKTKETHAAVMVKLGISEDEDKAWHRENGGKLSIRIEKGEREIAGHQTVFINCGHVDEKYNELKEKGANFYRDIEEFEWGTSFDIMDPDNNKVEFIHWK